MSRRPTKPKPAEGFESKVPFIGEDGLIHEKDLNSAVEKFKSHVNMEEAIQENSQSLGAGRKLTREQQLYLVKMIAHGLKSFEINEELEKNFGVQISDKLIYQYRHSPNWKEQIDVYRKEFITQIHEVPGSSKRVRLERLERMYAKAASAGRYREAIMAVAAQKDEVEGRDAHVNLIQFNQYNNLSDEEVEERRKQLIEKLQNLKPKESIDGV